MGKCCDGKNAYKPISKLRYWAGMLFFCVLHLHFRCKMFLRHLLVKKYTHYPELSRFHARYFKETLQSVLKKEGLNVNTSLSFMKVLWKAFVAIVFCVIFTLSLFYFNGPAKGYWDTYITLPAMFMADEPAQLTTKEGEILYEYTLPGTLPDNLVDKETYGIISKDQRLGTAILFAPWFSLFHQFGFRLLFAMIATLTAGLVFLTQKEVGSRKSIALFIGASSVLNAYVLSIETLNPNIAGMLLISLLLYLMVRKDPPWFLAGLLYGVLGGTRNIAILFTPALLFALIAWSPHKKKDGLFFFLGSLLAIAPILYWNHFAFGNPLIHPSQFAGLEGFRPTFEHTFLFWKFDFNGMFNFPLYHEIVRTPYFAFPTFLTLPLTILSTFGVILSALIGTGIISLWRNQRRQCVFLLLWLIPIYAMLSIQENWSDMKMTFLFLCFPSLLIFMGYGLESLFVTKDLKRNIFSTITLSIILFCLVRAAFALECPVDERWYVRFPRARGQGDICYIGDDLRTEKEDPQELHEQKKRLTQGNLLPRISIPDIDPEGTGAVMHREMRQRRIRVVDFWKYIYEE